MQGDRQKPRTNCVPDFAGYLGLRGLSVSSHVAERWGRQPEGMGRVVNVFRGCVNWVAADGELFCMVTRDAGNLPHGVVVDGARDFRHLGLTTETPVDADRSTVRFELDGPTVDLSNARTWSPVPPPAVGAPWTPACIDAAVAVLADPASAEGGIRLFSWIGELAAGRPFPIRGRPIERRLASACRTLSTAVRNRDSDAFAAAVDGLVGTGVGLTPSGDDILLGALSVLSTRGDTAASGKWFARSDRPLKVGIAGRTTRVAEAFLGHALNGRFPERLIDLLQAFESGDVLAVEDAARRLTRFGTTSGREMALGVLLADASLAAGQAAGRSAV